MRIAYWTKNVTNTQSEYVIGTAVVQKKRLQERASVLLFTYIACLVQMSVLRCLNNSGANCPMRLYHNREEQKFQTENSLNKTNCFNLGRSQRVWTWTQIICDQILMPSFSVHIDKGRHD